MEQPSRSTLPESTTGAADQLELVFGRLAMVAAVGIGFHEVTTGEGVMDWIMQQL